MITLIKTNRDSHLNAYKHNCCCISKSAESIDQRRNFTSYHYSQYLQNSMLKQPFTKAASELVLLMMRLNNLWNLHCIIIKSRSKRNLQLADNSVAERNERVYVCWRLQEPGLAWWYKEEGRTTMKQKKLSSRGFSSLWPRLMWKQKVARLSLCSLSDLASKACRVCCRS